MEEEEDNPDMTLISIVLACCLNQLEDKIQTLEVTFSARLDVITTQIQKQTDQRAVDKETLKNQVVEIAQKIFECLQR